MATTTKLEYIVENLLVKTKDNLCQWKRSEDKKFFLILGDATIYLYMKEFRTDSNLIVLEITNKDGIVIASRSEDRKNNTPFIILFNIVSNNYQEYVNSQIDGLLKELDKLGTF